MIKLRLFNLLIQDRLFCPLSSEFRCHDTDFGSGGHQGTQPPTKWRRRSANRRAVAVAPFVVSSSSLTALLVGARGLLGSAHDQRSLGEEGALLEQERGGRGERKLVHVGQTLEQKRGPRRGEYSSEEIVQLLCPLNKRSSGTGRDLATTTTLSSWISWDYDVVHGHFFAA